MNKDPLPANGRRTEMAITKKRLKAALADVRAKADEKQKEAQQANYRDDKGAAQYYDGMRSGYLLAALSIEQALAG